MAKWKVLRDNYGFKDGYWREGDVVEFHGSVDEDPKFPAEHFERIDQDAAVTLKAPRPEGASAMSEATKDQPGWRDALKKEKGKK